MKEFKGTKRKWSVFKKLNEFAITTIDETQAVCFMPALYKDSEANAKLIASAPEMFEMLREIYIERVNGGDFDTNKALKLLTKITK